MTKKAIFFLIVIVLLASFLRLWQIDTIPPGIYPDEALNANEAITNPGQVFYPDNNGREGLFFNLIWLSFSVFGISIWSFKLVSVLVGVLTVFGLFLLIRELFRFVLKDENKVVLISLLSSFFMAVSFWHINFSRISFRAIMLPLILVFSFYFLFRAFRTQKIKHFILAGIIFGLGFYTYISFRLAIFLLATVIFLWLVAFLKKKEFKKTFLSVFLFFAVVFATALPIGLYFLKNPQYFSSRTDSVLIFSQPNPPKEFAISLIAHLGMFNVYGDPNWRHNVAGHPMLIFPVGLLFLIGLAFCFKKLLLSIKEKDLISFNVFSFPFFWFFIMLLPGILTFEGIPHALRVIGVIPVIYIFVGVGAWRAFEFLNRFIKNKKLLFLISFVFLAGVAGLEFEKYFIEWAKNSEVKSAFTDKYNNIGWFMNSLPEDTLKYVVVNRAEEPLYGISIPGQVPMFVERIGFGHLRSDYIRAEELDKVQIISGRQTIIAPLYDGKIMDDLKQKFPQGEIEQKHGFWIYKIN